MLKLTLRPGEFIDIGENVRVIFSGGSSNNIHLLVEAPREVNVARSSAGGNGKSPYYKERDISEQAKREITEIIRRERRSEKNRGTGVNLKAAKQDS